MNPVTLKELRQLTRSRAIAGAIVGFFLLQLAAAALVVVSETNADGTLSSDCGQTVFVWLSLLLAPILAFVIPGNLFARLVSEHGPGRAEPLAATALRPSQVVDGKIRSGLVLLALFLSGALPFLLLSYLLGGVDVFYVLSWTLAVACCASVALHLSLAVAAFRMPAAARWCVWAAFAIPCVPFALLSSVGYKEELPWDEWEFLVFGGAAVVSIDLLLRGLAVALLSPPATDRVRTLRLTALALWLAWLATVVALSFAYPRGGGGAAPDLAENAAIYFFLAGFPLLALAAFDLSTPDGPSRRVLLDRPRTRLRRLLRFPFSSGAGGGLAFALILLGAGAAASLPPALAGRFVHANPEGFVAGQVLFAYLLAALLLSRAAFRIPALARRFGARGTVPLAAAFLGLAMGLPNVFAIGRPFDPDFVPFNLAGIDFDPAVPGVASGVFTPTGELSFHMFWAPAFLALGLALDAVPFFRSLRAYVGGSGRSVDSAPGPC